MPKTEDLKQLSRKRQVHLHKAEMKHQESIAGLHPLEALLLGVKAKVRSLDGSSSGTKKHQQT